MNQAEINNGSDKDSNLASDFESDSQSKFHSNMDDDKPKTPIDII